MTAASCSINEDAQRLADCLRKQLKRRDSIIDLKESVLCAHSKSVETHLVNVFEFVDDLIYDRVCYLHFDLRVSALSLDPVADHTEGVAVKKIQKRIC